MPSPPTTPSHSILPLFFSFDFWKMIFTQFKLLFDINIKKCAIKRSNYLYTQQMFNH
jgi:hypothetical protein